MIDLRPRLQDLAVELKAQRGRFTELVLFADDLEEVERIRIGEPPEGLNQTSSDGRSWSWSHDDDDFRLDIFSTGTARLRQSPTGSVTTARNGSTTASDAARAAIDAAAAKKGSGWSAGLFLGMLTGGPPLAAGPKRVLTLRFDSNKRDWKGYSGGLVSWMKDEFRTGR